MSQLIKPLSVRDTVLDISDSIDFAVFKSAQSITSQRYVANSSSNSQHIYAIQVPSVNTIISRNVIWGSDITFTLTGTVQPYEYLYNLTPILQGNNRVEVQGADTFAPFVLHQLCNNMNIQINNTNVVQNNVQQILDPILRGLHHKDIEKWYGTTPTQLDVYADYEDALPQYVSNAAALDQAVDLNQVPFIATENSPFNPYEYSYCTNDLQSRSSFKLISVTGNTPAGSTAAQKTVTVTIRVREPIFCSPFIFSGDEDQSGLVGITQINATMSMDATAKRALRWVLSNTVGSTKSVTNVVYVNPYMEFMQYTPKADQLVPATCVTAYSQFVNYILPAAGSLAIDGVSQLQSVSTQLNSIPDKCIVWVDDAYKYEANSNQIADHYATITGVNILFNNNSGILSTFSQEELYQASLKSGCHQSWAEFSGLQNRAPIGGAVNASGVSNVPTCGSVLYLNFGDVINIPELWNAPGSLMTTQFQITVNFVNNTGMVIKPQLNVMFLYSGILTTTNGNSASYINGILTRNDVLNSNNAPLMYKRELKRYVGSGVLSDMKSMANSYLPMAKDLLKGIDNKYAKLGAQTLDTLGYGVSAGGVSAGRMANKLM